MQRTCLSGSPVSQFCFWLMIVSIAIVVLPVARSPMISWRWPRPIGVIESIALMPVGQRLVHRLALHHAGRLELQGAALVGLDLAEAVDRACRAGRRRGRGSRRRRGPRGSRRCGGPSGPPRCRSKSPRTTTPISRVSRFRARPRVPSSNSQQLVGHGRGQALDAGDAVAGLGDRADLFACWPPRACSRRRTARSASRISSGRIVSSVIVVPALCVSRACGRVRWSGVSAVSRRAGGGRRRAGWRRCRR